ncbi:hypothetical protein Q7P37_005429 [Cladosporium fusiforme]
MTAKQMPLPEMAGDSDEFTIIPASSMVDPDPFKLPVDAVDGIEEPSESEGPRKTESAASSASKSPKSDDNIVAFLMEQNKRLIRRLPNVATISKDYAFYSNDHRPNDNADPFGPLEVPLPPDVAHVDPYDPFDPPKPQKAFLPPSGLLPLPLPSQEPIPGGYVHNDVFCEEAVEIWAAMLRLARVVEAASDPTAAMKDDFESESPWPPFDLNATRFHHRPRCTNAIAKLERKYGLKKRKPNASSYDSSDDGYDSSDEDDMTYGKIVGGLWTLVCKKLPSNGRSWFDEVFRLICLVALVAVAFQLYVIADAQKTRTWW